MLILFIFLCLLAAAGLGGAWYAYRIAFYSPKKDRDKINPLRGKNLTAMYWKSTGCFNS